MNDIFATVGIVSWKPVIGALLLPPVPLILLMLVGGHLLYGRRRIGWAVLIAAALGLWFMCTAAAGMALSRLLLAPPRALSPAEVGALRGAPKTAIVVLGGGGKALAPEYAAPSLNNFGIERLRYGVWLARQTALPLAFSGGLGHGSRPGPSEAEVAARIAQTEFGHPLRWTEAGSRDTNENALLTLPLLKAQGIERVVLVTHDFHMPRALAAFERASRRTAIPMTVTPAPMGMGATTHTQPGDWLPSRTGFVMVNLAFHEWLGRIGGA